MLTIIDPLNNQSFPSVAVGERRCFAIPYGRAFAVKVEPGYGGFFEAVISVDGRNALDNSPASPAASGVVTSNSYVCKGFQINSETVRQFVHMPSGEGLLTAERAGAPDALGMVAVAVYSEARSFIRPPSHLESFGGPVMRGTGGGERTMRGGGAMAGAEVSASLGTTMWTRAGQPTIAVVEYDTYEGWAARGIVIPRLSDANPWPGAAPRFAAAGTL